MRQFYAVANCFVYAMIVWDLHTSVLPAQIATHLSTKLVSNCTASFHSPKKFEFSFSPPTV